MTILACSVLLIELTFPGLAGAAARPPEGLDQKQLLSLDTAVAIALDKNSRLRPAVEGVTAAKEASGEARAHYYPDLNFTAGYSRWERHAFLPSGLAPPGIPKIIGPTDDWSTALRTRYMLFDTGRQVGGRN